jgi:hypothetical protein
MDPDLGVYFRFARFGLPAGISLSVLVRLWWIDELNRRPLFLFCSWFLAAVAAQLLTSSVFVWAGGLAAQTLLAIVLIVKLRLSEIS